MQRLIQDLDSLGIAAARLSHDRHVTVANAEMARVLGVDSATLVGMDIAEIVTKTSREHISAGLSTVYRIDNGAGPCWYRLDLKTAKDGFVALLIELGEDHRPHKENRDYLSVRDRLLQDGKIGTWRYDPDAELYYFSSELSLGYDGAGAAVPVPMLQRLQHPDDHAKDTQIRDRITREGGTANAEMRYREADGSWTHLNVHYRSGRQLPSGRYEMFGVSQNITPVAIARDEANQLSERLGRALRDADYANRTKTEFLANMSHELRTPLNAILGFSEMIERSMFGPLNAKYKDYAHDIHRSGRHLLELVNDVLDLAKLEAGKLELRETDLYLPDLVDDCLALVRGKADASGVHLSRELEAGALTLRADTRAVKQVLLNFLSNAVKFTSEGGRVTVRSAIERDGALSLSVTDSGIGMTAPEIEVALSPFGQVDSALARRHEGTGLGLPICKSLMELHGGALLITSKPNIGTTLLSRFPASRVPSDPAARATNKAG
jgi:signal transduction histidine kinase